MPVPSVRQESPKWLQIVVITNQRLALVKQNLFSLKTSLETAGLTNASLIRVMLNGPDIQTFNALKEIESDVNFELLVLQSTHFPSQARNLCVDYSSGFKWVYFIDDDAYVPHDFFSQFLQLIQTHSEATLIGGPNLTPPNTDRFQVLSGQLLGCPWFAGSFSHRYSEKANSAPGSISNLVLCNLFVRMDYFKKCPFPAHWDCGEELKMLSEILSVPGTKLFERSLFVYHDRRQDPRSFYQQIFKYGKGRGYYIQTLSLPLMVRALSLLILLTLLTALILAPRILILVLIIELLILFKCWFVVRDKIFPLSVIILSSQFHYAIGVFGGIWKKVD